MPLSLEDTTRKLDEEIRALLDSRDILYSVEKITGSLSATARANILKDAQARVTIAAEAILAIDIAGAEVGTHEHA